jgi:NADPH:quinone reductase-like Zn-dependent oxidoreductase
MSANAAVPDTMMALRAHVRGGPEQLVFESAPVPVPGPGEALVAVHTAAITFAELSWDESWTTRDGRDRTPVIPSHEVSGTVAALGPGADGVTVGEEVYGLIDFDRDGAAAEYVTLPAAHLAARPRSVSDVEAASLPLAALTAWQALIDHAALEPGERFLAPGAGNTAGYKAVAPDGFDVVLDTIGGAVLDASYELTRRGGRLVTLSAPPSADKAAALGVHAMFFVVTPDAAELATLAGLVDEGRLRPVVSQGFPLRDGRQAFESATKPHPPGKTVLTVP